jgi:hypothetical protein
MACSISSSFRFHAACPVSSFHYESEQKGSDRRKFDQVAVLGRASRSCSYGQLCHNSAVRLAGPVLVLGRPWKFEELPSMMYAVRMYVAGLLTHFQSAMSQALCPTGWPTLWGLGLVITDACNSARLHTMIVVSCLFMDEVGLVATPLPY